MAQELVTLEHPDGRRYRTDSATEINLLVGSYGYQRVEQKSQSPQGKRVPKSTSPAPSPAPEPSASGEAPSS